MFLVAAWSMDRKKILNRLRNYNSRNRYRQKNYRLLVACLLIMAKMLGCSTVIAQCCIAFLRQGINFINSYEVNSISRTYGPQNVVNMWKAHYRRTVGYAHATVYLSVCLYVGR